MRAAAFHRVISAKALATTAAGQHWRPPMALCACVGSTMTKSQKQDQVALTGNSLERLSEETFNQLCRRLEAAQLLQSVPDRSRAYVEGVAATIGVHVTTVYRDLARLVERGTVRDLVPRKRGYPKGRSKLTAEQEEIIQRFLASHYLQRQKISIVELTQRIGWACVDAGFPAPTRAAINRRIEKIPKRSVALARHGRKEAEKHTPRPGAFKPEAPWDVWQIDHTLVDVIVVDSVHRRPIGRAWITLVIDVATRAVTSFYVGLEEPSIVRAATAIDLGVQVKDNWLMRTGLTEEYQWPMCGLPRLVHSDRAGEFRSQAFTRALKNQGVHTFLRPAGRPHWGGHIERLVGTVMGECRVLPGATYNSPAARGDYDSKKSARLTVDELELWMAHQILGRYHNTVHSALGVTPLEAWQAKTAGREPQLPVDIESFRLDLLPETVRTMSRYGISLFNEQYYSEELGAALRAGRKASRIKYDPRDLSEIYVWVDDHYITVPYRFSDNQPPRTLWLYQAARRAVTESGQRLSRATARRATARAEALVVDAAKYSERAARQAERLRLSRREVEIAKEGAPATFPATDDDDWGGFFGDDQ